MADIETDFLISGAGPSGASLACFLAQYGLKGIMIAASPSTADTPRAHITNMAALECLRDIGLQDECLEVATHSSCMEHTRWCHSMAGDEYARIHSWGHDPKRAGDYDAASPCNHVDLPQTLLEPILVNRAKEEGFDVRFSTQLISFKIEENGKIVSQIRDGTADKTYNIKSKYLFGCDGARSQIVRDLKLPLIKKPGGGVAINVLVEADLEHLVKSRVGNLHWVIQPDRDYPDYAAMSIVRMVRPWKEWMFICFPKTPDTDVSGVSEEQWLEEVKVMIGDDSIPVKIKNIATWKVNEIVAEKYSEGNIFCLGDAVHRHPPFNGLGSNTCIQDAYNLAWKIAYVHEKLASPSILSSYSIERQPVGQGVISRANQGFRDHVHVWQALGITEPDRDSRLAAFNELKAATPAGRRRRADLQAAIEGTRYEFHAVGQEMNQRYDSNVIYLSDETNPRPSLPTDPILTHQITTYPGSRLPHAWLNTRIPGAQISTIDLAGHGAFSLITGIGGLEAWTTAARTVSQDLCLDGAADVPINVHSIGWGQEYEDVYSDWARRREVAEDGCVLVRPDRFVCWRCMDLPSDRDQCTEKLRRVMKSVLGLSGQG